MVRLQEHLKYFVVDRISHDPQWQGPKVYLSGHEVGEIFALFFLLSSLSVCSQIKFKVCDIVKDRW